MIKLANAPRKIKYYIMLSVILILVVCASVAISKSCNSCKKLHPVKVGEVWGYEDAKGNIVIRPQFDYAAGFSEGLAAVQLGGFADSPYTKEKTGGEWGFIDTSGHMVIPPVFRYESKFAGGIVVVAKDIENNGEIKYGVLNKKGEVVAPFHYEKIGEYKEGLALACVGGSSSNGINETSGGKWGFLDEKGKLVIPCIFDNALSFSQGLAPIFDKNDKLLGYIDKTSKIVIEGKFDTPRSNEASTQFSEGLAAYELNGKVGFINKKGETVINPQFEYVYSFKEGLARVLFDVTFEGSGAFPHEKSSGFIDKTGKIVIPAANARYNDFSEGLAMFEENGKYGFIDKKGRKVIPAAFDEADDFRDGYARVRKGGNYGVIDKKGKFQLKALHSSI